MFNPTILKKTLISTALFFALAGPVCARTEALPAIEEAHRAYYLGESERALQIYERLASTGDAEAAERAGFILLRRAGTGGQAHAARATALLVQAARAGRQGAAFVLGMLDSAD
jgi:hypothetical protein